MAIHELLIDPGVGPKSAARWKRVALFDDVARLVYVPLAVWGGEEAQRQAAGDRVVVPHAPPGRAVIRHGSRPFVAVLWLAPRFPPFAARLEAIEANVINRVGGADR